MRDERRDESAPRKAGDNACLRLLGQMALVAVIIGASVATAATERVTASLVLTSALAWAFVPLIQLGTGLWLVRSAGAGRRIPALEHYFDTHRPWSLFILAVHAVLVVWPASRAFALAFVPLAALPITMTVSALMAMCRDVLGMSTAAARRMVLIHQVITYVMAAAYASWASAHVPRFVGLFR